MTVEKAEVISLVREKQERAQERKRLERPEYHKVLADQLVIHPAARWLPKRKVPACAIVVRADAIAQLNTSGREFTLAMDVPLDQRNLGQFGPEYAGAFKWNGPATFPTTRKAPKVPRRGAFQRARQWRK